MGACKPFKVVVVGGGVAGLTLANMLQKFDIDFVVLESHGEIAPAVGASIGLFPSGLRILDQIDCFEPILAMPQASLHYTHFRDTSGKAMDRIVHWQEHLEKRHGYPILFFDRQWLLQMLYDQLEDKSRVLLRKKVGRIEHNTDGVRVTTVDGETFDGSIVVGADGIHSAVRKEMNRMAQELPCGPFKPGQEDEIPCYYKCNFGIAQNVDGWTRHDQSSIFGDGKSALVLSGPENRVYWFIFVRLPEVKHGGSIPKYTKEDEEAFAKEYADIYLNDNVKFRDVYRKKLSSTLTPLHEMVYKTWFYRRVILLGDSAHKPNPIGGQGGNGAIESAAELINALIEARDTHHGLENLQEEDFSRIFARMQSVRNKRAHFLVEYSHQRQALMASESRLKTTLATTMMALVPAANLMLPKTSIPIVGSSKINRLPVPFRPRAIPFEDERPAVPVTPETSKTIRQIYTGAMLASSILAAVTTPAWPASDLWQHVAPILMYTIEGHRAGNGSPILATPSVMAIGLHGLGINRVIPSYALLHAFSAFDAPPERAVPISIAKSILGAFTLSGLVASAKYMLDRHRGVPTNLQSSLWKLSALFPTLVWALSKLSRGGRSKRRPDIESDTSLDRYKTHDMPYLRATYLCAFGVQAVAHVASGAPSLIGQTLLGALTDAVTSPSAFLASLASLPSGARLACGVWVLQNLYAIWDMRRAGYIKTFSALKAAVGVALGQILVGPGATWAGLWYWRDEVFAGSMIK
ncbi:FAD/NAD(P)-binding domain-containing protein [Colletotrichum eremochloae]|nr:FAD/NAD(P)-binding domain-containing protein [Colletotrichum eremochloae]